MKQSDDVEFRELLSELRSHPEVFSRAEAPVGYEERLLRNLDKRLNKKASFFRFSRIQKQWGWAAGTAVIAIFTLTSMLIEKQSGEGKVEVDSMLVHIANEGGEGLVDHWAAMQGDTLAQRTLASSDFSAVLSQAESSKKTKKLLEQLSSKNL